MASFWRSVPRISCLGALVFLSVAAGQLSAARGADYTARDVTEMLFLSDGSVPVDLKSRNLQNLDLAGLDFKRAELQNADLFGSDLSGANLSGVNLEAARLDRVILIGSTFDGANLEGVTLLRPTSFSSLEERLSEASSFIGVNMQSAKVFGQFNGFNFEGAKMKGVSFAPFNETGFIEHIWRSELDGANLANADLEQADLTYASLRFANLRNAILRGAILRNADLSHADLTGADLAGADITGADLDLAVLRDVKGLDSALGLDKTANRSKAIE